MYLKVVCRNTGNRVRMTLQLINQYDNHVWSEQYDREITSVEEQLSLQSEIAQLVADQLQVPCDYPRRKTAY